MRICVYTAIYGGYDELKQPVPQDIDCDYICFTEATLAPKIGVWRLVRSNLNPTLIPRMRARYFKLMNHKIFPRGRLAWRFSPFSIRHKYDITIWVDGCLQIKSPAFVSEFVGHIRDNGWSMFIHPDRDCIYDELEAARGMAKCKGQPLVEQVAHYAKEGFPSHAGLMASTTIARRMSEPSLEAINSAWWTEVSTWSNRDQISLPVVLRRLGRDYDKVQMDLWDNHWFDCRQHNSML